MVVAMNKQRLNVHLYVTPICNLNCIHCYYEAKDVKYNIKNILSIDDMKFIIKTLIDNYDAYFDIEGGELFLRNDINKLFNSLDKKYLQRLTLTTNGTINFDLKEKYLKNLDEFRISFEGDTNILQQQIRGIELDKPLNLAINLLKNQVMPTIRITIHKYNYKKIKQIINFFSSYGLKKFSFYEFIPVGRGEKHINLELDDKEFEVLAKQIKSLEYDDISYKFSFPKKRLEYFDNYLNISQIPSLTINYNGDIGICPWQIGKDIFAKYNKENFLNEIKKQELIHSCNYCSSIRIINA